MGQITIPQADESAQAAGAREPCFRGSSPLRIWRFAGNASPWPPPGARP